MLHTVSFTLVLFGAWLLLSFFLEPLLLGFGVISCLIVIVIARRMDVIDHEGHPVHLGWRVITYWVWLAWEIAKSSVDVSRRIIDPKLPIDPVLVHVKTSQRSDLGQVIYANSITLTPGTVSVQVADGDILVHSIASEMAEDLEAGAMDRRVTGMEGATTRSETGAA